GHSETRRSVPNDQPRDADGRGHSEEPVQEPDARPRRGTREHQEESAEQNQSQKCPDHNLSAGVPGLSDPVQGLSGHPAISQRLLHERDVQDFFIAWMKGEMMSMGMGKIVVEFFSDATSTSVWRNRSCKAIGLRAMISAASKSFWAAWNSPSA